MKIKGAIFDMDGTLIDSLGIWEVFWSEIGKRYMHDDSFVPDEELDRKCRTTLFSEDIRLIKEFYNLSEPLDELLKFGEDLVYDYYRTKTKVKSGVIELLEYLRANNVKLCLASAGDRRYIDVAFDALGLGKYITEIISCADVGKGKDAPDVFYRAAEVLGEGVGDICVFEDSCVAIETAKKAGFITVGVFDKHSFGHDRLKAASDHYVDDGMSLDSIIDKL